MSKLRELAIGLITYELALDELDELKRVYDKRQYISDIVNISGDKLADAIVRLNVLAGQVLVVANAYVGIMPPMEATKQITELELLKTAYHYFTKTGIPKKLLRLKNLDRL